MFSEQHYDGELSEQHARLLEWFFGAGRATFGRSTCGAIIDRLLMFSFGSDPCDACGGTGFRGGWSYGDEAAVKLSAVEELAALLDVKIVKGKVVDGDAVCRVCRGSGVAARASRRRSKEPITARPRTLATHGQGYTPTDYALQHYAIACRRLDALSAASPKAATVLEAFFGDWGGRWADTDEGRIFAVYAFTAAGHKLLRMSRDKAKLEACELRPDEVLGVEFALQRTQPKKLRAELFKSARDQAKRLLESACRAWNAPEAAEHEQRRVRRAATDKVRRDIRIREILAGAPALPEADENASEHVDAWLLEPPLSLAEQVVARDSSFPEAS